MNKPETQIVVEPGKPNNGASEKPRLKDYSLSLIALTGLVIMGAIGFSNDHFKNVLDFSKQTWSFGITTVAIIAIGFNVGQVNYRAKKVWATADLLWISFAVFGLSGMLAPIEQYVTAQRIENAAVMSDVHYEGLVRKTNTAQKLACGTAPDSAMCLQWKKFESSVLAVGLTPRNIVERVDDALVQVPAHLAMNKIRGEIVWSRDELRAAFAEGSAARNAATNISIGGAYFTLALFIVAVGFRAGRTGAEFAKNRKE